MRFFFRIFYRVPPPPHGRTETRALAVAMPETEAAAATALFASGLPVPYSLEVAGLAAMTAFLHGPAPKHKDAAVGLVDFGSASTLLGLFNNETPALIRRFDRGSATVLE
jgi:hypothetical protein